MFCFVLSPRLSLTTQDVFVTFEIWILQKRMDSQQEAFIHPPEPCEVSFLMDLRTLFYVIWTA